MIEKAKDAVIVALDFPNLSEAKELVEKLGDSIKIYKVGLELFLNTNGEIIDYLKSKGKEIFLDLKFHDIENTVLAACKYALERGVMIFNIHSTVGLKAMQAISKLVKETNENAKVIAVTVLTNLSDEDVKLMYGEDVTVEKLVSRLAGLTAKAGLDGVVCSAKEAKTLKEENGKDFITLCPGIRPAGADVGDQKRVMTPSKAIENMADYLVIGRPITKADDPLKVANEILNEVAVALCK